MCVCDCCAPARALAVLLLQQCGIYICRLPSVSDTASRFHTCFEVNRGSCAVCVCRATEVPLYSLHFTSPLLFMTQARLESIPKSVLAPGISATVQEKLFSVYAYPGAPPPSSPAPTHGYVVTSSHRVGCIHAAARTSCYTPRFIVLRTLFQRCVIFQYLYGLSLWLFLCCWTRSHDRLGRCSHRVFLPCPSHCLNRTGLLQCLEQHQVDWTARHCLSFPCRQPTAPITVSLPLPLLLLFI